MNKTGLAVGLCLAASLAVAAVSDQPGPAQGSASAWSASAQDAVSQDAEAAQSVRPVSSRVPAIANDLVPGTAPQSVTDLELKLHTSWLKLPAAPALEKELSADAARRESDYRAARGGSADGELTMTVDLVAASPKVIGVRSVSHRSVAGAVQHDVRTLWYDVEAKRLLKPGDLLRGGDESLRRLVGGRSGRDQLSSADLDSVEFSKDGDLIVSFDSETDAVAIPAGDITSQLSELGNAAAAATASPSKVPFEAPAEQPVSVAPVSSARVDCATAKCVALTFDDGPSQETTPQLLRILSQNDVKATFFVLGQQVKASPQVLSAEAAAGHEIGNHTYRHRQLTTLPSAAVTREVTSTDDEVKAVIGRPTTVMRPPYGAQNPRTNEATPLPVILWDVDTLDWKTRSSSATVAAVKRAVRPGSIVLMHDIHQPTVDAVPAVIAYLKAQGYELVTVSELLAAKNPQPHQAFQRLD